MENMRLVRGDEPDLLLCGEADALFMRFGWEADSVRMRTSSSPLFWCCETRLSSTQSTLLQDDGPWSSFALTDLRIPPPEILCAPAGKELLRLCDSGESSDGRRGKNRALPSWCMRWSKEMSSSSRLPDSTWSASICSSLPCHSSQKAKHGRGFVFSTQTMSMPSTSSWTRLLAR